MLRILLSLTPMLAACAPSPQKVAVPNHSPVAAATAQAPLADTPAEAAGRRIISTAFVRLGPDGYLTVELRTGTTLVLRNVVMGPKDYCGAQVAGNPPSAKFCGGYAEVVAARPGGGPPLDQPVSEASTPVSPTKPH